MKKSNLGILGFGVVLGLMLMLVGWQVFGQAYTFQGSLIDPPVPAAEIALPDQNGDMFRLSEQQGKVTLIFFGYTNCPDVCPVTLSEYKQIYQALGEDAEQVNFVFITVDPERDTPARLRSYLPNFGAPVIGLVGDQASLAPIKKAYGVYAEKVESDSALGYLVDHTARVYAIDRQGNWRLTYPFGIEVDKIIADVRHLIAEK